MFIVTDSRVVVFVCLFFCTLSSLQASTQCFSGFEKCLVKVWSQLGFSQQTIIIIIKKRPR